MRPIIVATLLSAGVLATAPASARDITVDITNVTNGSYFTPLLVAAHRRSAHLFQLGEAASNSVRDMAEGGTLDGLIAEVEAIGGTYVDNPHGDVLGPGETTSATLSLRGHGLTNLSITAMVLPSNDAFVGLDAVSIPRRPGTYTLLLSAYDAGTEANDEIVNGGGDPGVPGIPADPGGNNGVGATGAAGPDGNTNVHVHRGVLGDDDPLGGPSDLDRSIHRWQNPVARVVVTVHRGHDDD